MNDTAPTESVSNTTLPDPASGNLKDAVTAALEDANSRIAELKAEVERNAKTIGDLNDVTHQISEENGRLVERLTERDNIITGLRDEVTRLGDASNNTSDGTTTADTATFAAANKLPVGFEEGSATSVVAKLLSGEPLTVEDRHTIVTALSAVVPLVTHQTVAEDMLISYAADLSGIRNVLSDSRKQVMEAISRPVGAGLDYGAMERERAALTETVKTGGSAGAIAAGALKLLLTLV